MVGPVQAVGCSLPGMSYALSQALYCDGPFARQGMYARVGWDRVSCARRAGTQFTPSQTRLESGLLDRFERSCTADLLSCAAWLYKPLVWGAQTDAWQPWPIAPPAVDRHVIRWPSDDWPPATPPIRLEDRQPDAPVQILFWNEVGGLLDMWA